MPKMSPVFAFITLSRMQKIYHKSLSIAILTMILIQLTAIGEVYASCLPTPTSGADTISCSGTSTNVTSGSQFDTSTGDDILTNVADGIINMILLFNDGADQLFNEGTISNPISFGAGNESYTYDNAAGNSGTINGYINMSAGDDILTIGKNFNPANKDTASFQSISGNSILMGYGTDVLTINSEATVTGNIVTSGYSYVAQDILDDTDAADTVNVNGTLAGNLWM